MGYMRHHAILVTSWQAEALATAHERAHHIFDAMQIGQVSGVSAEVTNGYRSFCVFPDGSKEGWPTSDEGDAAREAFITYLRTTVYDDGSGRIEWAEVQYGDEDLETKICANSDDDQRTYRKVRS